MADLTHNNNSHLFHNQNKNAIDYTICFIIKRYLYFIKDYEFESIIQ